MTKPAKIKLTFALLMIFTGLVVFSYPFISNRLAALHATTAVHDYNETVEELAPEEIDAIKQAAASYNQELDIVADRNASGEGEVAESYIDILDAGEAMGYITVPCIDLSLPIYEGTSANVLSHGIGHLSETSYPLGGESTHSALSGHRGLAEAELFTNLDKVQIGDRFYLHILDEVLAYEVDRISVVEPDDVSELEVIEGEDLCTLVTCTPLGINSHRLLVRGHRVEYTGEEEETSDTVLYQSVHTGTAVRRLVEIWPWLTLAAVLIIGAEAFILIAILRRIRIDREED